MDGAVRAHRSSCGKRGPPQNCVHREFEGRATCPSLTRSIHLPRGRSCSSMPSAPSDARAPKAVRGCQRGTAYLGGRFARTASRRSHPVLRPLCARPPFLSRIKRVGLLGKPLLADVCGTCVYHEHSPSSLGFDRDYQLAILNLRLDVCDNDSCDGPE